MQLILVRLAGAGTIVKKGDLLVEFDRTNQLRTVCDREAEYRDFEQQINRRRGEHLSAKALRDTQLKQASNDLAIARLGVVGNDTIGSIAAEKNRQTLEEAEARLKQLTRTFDLRQRVEAADMRILQIQQERALNAWQHAQRNVEKMRITSPLDGLVVLRSVFRQGSMAEVREGEEVRAGVPILDARRGRSVGDARAGERQPGRHPPPRRRPAGGDHARLVSVAAVQGTPGIRVADRDDQRRLEPRPVVRRSVHH
jgi:multidrug efflux pump subunit AcrA (membrane-fusion protein)